MLPTYPLVLDRKALGLTELTPRGSDMSTTRAALALDTWFAATGVGRGIAVPESAEVYTSPGKGGNASFRIHHPMPGLKMTATAYVFIDQSAIVTLRHYGETPARHIALPVLFRLRQHHRQDGQPFARIFNPDRSEVAARLTFEDVYGNHGETWTTDEFEGASDEIYHHPVIRAVRDDLRALVPLFKNLPWVVRPIGPVPDAPSTPEEIMRLGLPAEAMFQPIGWTPHLAHRRITMDEHRVLRELAQDFADWLLSLSGGRYQDVVAQITTILPDRLATTESPMSITCTRTGKPSLSGGPAYFMAEPERLNLGVSHERFSGFSYNQANTIVPKPRADRLASCAGQVISAHRTLALTRKFGPLRSDLFEN